MRERLISYVELMFAGNPEASDIKQEILQNTLDRYDDLVAEGRSPENAYSLAISGIGDLSELLQGNTARQEESFEKAEETQEELKKKKLMRAVAVGLYIACPIPLFAVPNELGLCLLLALVALATVLMIFGSLNEKEKKQQTSPENELKRGIHSAVSTVGLIVYFIVSFLTGAWHLTWLIFPLTGAINGLVSAIMDLKEEK